nr:unnamed protein product [Callosobruchus chinensis]
MSEEGLVPVDNPSSLFLMAHDREVVGSAVFAGIEGSSPILMEVQTLIAGTTMAIPRRAVVGSIRKSKECLLSDKNDPNVGTGLVGAPSCGDVRKLQIKVNDKGVIKDAIFKTFGCGSAIASSSLLTEMIKGRTVSDVTQIKNTQIVEELSLPPVKIHCSVLAEDAIKAAIHDYQSKQSKDGH